MHHLGDSLADSLISPAEPSFSSDNDDEDEDDDEDDSFLAENVVVIFVSNQTNGVKILLVQAIL